VKWSAFLTGLRDMVTISIGSYILVLQALTAKDHPESVNFWLLAVGAGLLTAPGAIGVWMVRRGSGEIPPTPEPPSRHRPSASQRRH
jgi:hypothetical protein